MTADLMNTKSPDYGGLFVTEATSHLKSRVIFLVVE
jgi:hypothetical protein